MKIVIGIATAGRAELLPKVIDDFRSQTRLPDAIYICPASDADYDLAQNEPYPVPIHVVRGSRGLPAQRNAIMRSAHDADIIIFFDDDYIADPEFLSEAEALFREHAEIVMATGDVVADGALGPGIELDDAKASIAKLDVLPKERLVERFNAYGCNMAVRTSAAFSHDIEFDEKLPLYGWWEDVDFSRRMAPFGRIVRSNRLRGVHMGSKSGRTPGQRLGYSQVANVVYMVQKGSVPFSVGAVRIARNVFANGVRQVKPEPWADRRGRFIGNVKAIIDCIRAPADPQRALKL